MQREIGKCGFYPAPGATAIGILLDAVHFHELHAGKSRDDPAGSFVHAASTASLRLLRHVKRDHRQHLDDITIPIDVWLCTSAEVARVMIGYRDRFLILEDEFPTVDQLVKIFRSGNDVDGNLLESRILDLEHVIASRAASDDLLHARCSEHVNVSAN